MAPLLELDNVSITFGGGGSLFGRRRRVGAVAGVSLTLDSGEIIAIVGESGCGKTTLGKMVTGMLKATGGRILYQGADIKSLRGDAFSAYRKGVQTVHQDSYAALNPARTILQSLSDPILHHKMARNKTQAHQKLEELLTLVGLVPPDQFLDKYPHQLSGGQRQRLLLARALSLQPSLIVADEPVSMVDVSLRISLLDLMGEMNRRFNIAFIYITHDLATARYIASHGRIAVMYPGKVVETGNLSQVMADPRHPYLQALLAAVPIPDPKLARNMPELPLKSLEMPDPSNPPPGCRFHPRCPFAEAICATEEPLLRDARRPIGCLPSGGPHTEVEMGVTFLRAILSFGIVMLALSLISLLLVAPDSPGSVAAVLSVGANGITVGGSLLILRWLLAKEQD